jgi:hypothetical protein
MSTKENVSAYIDWYNEGSVLVVERRAREGKAPVSKSMHGVTTKHVHDHSHPDQTGSQVVAQRFHDAVIEGHRRGPVSAAEGLFKDHDALSLSPSRKCNELSDTNLGSGFRLVG